ncbi:MAG: ribonuclease Y [Anaerolineaceae bacterium]|nr:ribonuclease Y [Anaerolineaceae bacterium]
MNWIQNNWFLMVGVTVAAVVILTIIFVKVFKARYLRDRQNEADAILAAAQEKARAMEMAAKDDSLRMIKSSEEELARRRGDLNQEEERLQRRRAELDTRVDKLEQKEAALNKRQSSLDRKANELDKQEAEQVQELERIAQMSRDEAHDELLVFAEKEAQADVARIIRQIENEARQEGEKRAREIVADSIQRVASDHVAEVSTKVVPLPNEEMKGRIVGRNGRNIRAFEQAAGVDVIVDDTPEAVTISCFDSVRREIARRSLERLILDGRIHPAYIEKVLNEEQREMERSLVEAGEEAAYDAGIAGLHHEIIKKMGRLKFRTSYGQNQLAHAVESSKLASVIAAELGANVEVAKLGGFLHDLGKAIDHDTEGTHAQLGAEFAGRYGVNKTVCNIIASHHREVEQDSVEAVIVEAADAISGARPGARREDLEQYIKRLKALEEIANSYKGVEQSYAIQAGREVRIMVKPEDIDDLTATRLARDIARNIEESMQYPGQIKVTVIRETRAVDYAK